MPRILDTESRMWTVVNATNHVLVRDGLPGLTMRPIAAQSRVSAATLIEHYGSRAHLLKLVAPWTGRLRAGRIRDAEPGVGVTAFLPRSDDDVLLARAWLGWCELARNDPLIGLVVAQARAAELALLAQTLDYALDRRGLAAVTALVDGLMVQICLPERPLPPAEARMVLLAQVELLLAPAAARSAATIASGSSAE